MLMGGAKGFGVMAGAAKDAAGMAGSAAATAGGAVASGVTKAAFGHRRRVEKCGVRRGGFGRVPCPGHFRSRHRQGFEAGADAGATVGNRINSAAAAGREYGAAIQSGFPKAWRNSRCCSAPSALRSAPALRRPSPPRRSRAN
jgi:hypothetical protein